MPYLGAPFLSEGSPEALFENIALIRYLGAAVRRIGLPWGRAWVVAGVVTLLAGAYAGGVFEEFRDVETARATLASWGTWAYVLYFVAFSLLEPLGVPALLFIIPASVIWGPWIALGLSLPGGVCAGILGFAFARYLARDWVASRLPARLRRFDDRLEKNAFAAVVLVRVAFFLFPPAHWLLGLSSVRFKPFVLGTAVGLVPGLLASTFLGGGVAQWLVRQPFWVWVLLAAALTGAVVVRHRLPHESQPPPG